MDWDKVEAESLTPQQADYVEVENQCCLCGTTLEFEHGPHDDNPELVIEKAHCPCCKIQMKEREFVIH